MASLAELRMDEPEEIQVEPQMRPEELRILEALLFASTEPLEQATLAVMRDPEVVKLLTEQQVTPMPSGAPEFEQLIKDDLLRWENVVKAAGIKGE